MDKTLGRRIKKVRGMRDMTQKQLAAKALISRGYTCPLCSCSFLFTGFYVFA